MKVSATDKALRVINEVKSVRSGRLVITLGTGCCESTAPFLYEDFDPGPDAKKVGDIAGVEVYAPGWLADLYEGDEMVIDADTEVITESFSIETVIDARLKLEIPERELPKP
ncbi:MAG: hypothetical protein C4318_04550 [Acidimicrobiia bacterium]